MKTLREVLVALAEACQQGYTFELMRGVRVVYVSDKKRLHRPMAVRYYDPEVSPRTFYPLEFLAYLRDTDLARVHPAGPRQAARLLGLPADKAQQLLAAGEYYENFDPALRRALLRACRLQEIDCQQVEQQALGETST